ASPFSNRNGGFMSEASPVKAASTQYQRLMRAFYTFLGCGIAGAFFLYLFLYVSTCLLFRVSGMGRLAWLFYYFTKLIQPLADLLMSLVYPNEQPMHHWQATLFYLVLFFIMGLIVGLPVAIVVYFIPPRSREHA